MAKQEPSDAPAADPVARCNPLRGVLPKNPKYRTPGFQKPEIPKKRKEEI